MKRLFRLPPDRDGVRRDVDAELAFHVEGRIDELMAQGLSRDEAERQAVRRFGDRDAFRAELERADEAARVRRSLVEWLDAFVLDARFAFRSLSQHPVYSTSVIATLALGIGANTAIFSVTDALLFRSPPFPHPSELVSLWGSTGSAGEFATIRQHARSFSSLATYAESPMNIGDQAGTVRADGSDVSESFFSTLGAAPALGRTFSKGAELPGALPEVILSDALWRSRFGAVPGIVGGTILVEGVPRTVVGVMNPNFHFPALGTQLWIPSTFDPSHPGDYWGWVRYHFIGRLRPGSTLAAAGADLKSVVSFLRSENSITAPGPTYGALAVVVPLQAELAGPARTTLLVLLSVVFALLLIACANVAHLVLVRSSARVREFEVRTALGCSRGRMVRQLLTENLLLAGLGGAAGVALAWSGVRTLAGSLPSQLARTATIVVDSRILGFAAAITVCAGLAFALLPAMRAAKSGLALRGRGTSQSAEHRRLSGALTIAQLAAAVVLVSGSGLLLRSFNALQHVNPGFTSNRLVAAEVTLPSGPYVQPARRIAFLDALLVRLESSPTAAAVAAVDRPPLRDKVYRTGVVIEGQGQGDGNASASLPHLQRVTSAYFATLGIPIVRGRGFTAADRLGTPNVAIVSEAMARRSWPNEDPIGRRIQCGACIAGGGEQPAPANLWITVVGVAGEVKQDSLNATQDATVYRPLAQSPQTDLTIMARTLGDPVEFIATLKAGVSALDGMAPVSQVRTMDDVVSASLARARFTAMLLSGFALLALVLGAVGIYGVVSAAVAQRTRELGVRIALGATPRRILWLVLGRGAALAGCGAALGVAIALAVTRALAGLLYGVTATDALTFVLAPMLLFGVAIAATWIPARRAVRVDPAITLRAE